jgi:hypothetical protein
MIEAIDHKDADWWISQQPFPFPSLPITGHGPFATRSMV